MSSVLLLKDHDSQTGDRPIVGKKGDVISVPFVLRKHLLAQGIAADIVDGKPVQRQPATQIDIPQPDNGAKKK